MPSVNNYRDKENTSPAHRHARPRRNEQLERQNTGFPRPGVARIPSDEVILEQDLPSSRDTLPQYPLDLSISTRESLRHDRESENIQEHPMVELRTMASDSRSGRDRSPVAAFDFSAPTRDRSTDGRASESLPFREHPTFARNALAAESPAADLDTSSDPEDMDSTINDMRGLESNIQAPFLFPSFINTLSLPVGPDCIFSRLKSSDGCARTSSLSAERYRRQEPKLPPISTLLKRRTSPYESSGHHRQTGHTHESSNSSLGEFIAEAARVASELVAAARTKSTQSSSNEGEASSEEVVENIDTYRRLFLSRKSHSGSSA